MNAIKLSSFSIVTMGFALAISAPLPVFGPSLAHQYISGLYKLAAVSLDAQSLRITVTPVS